MYLEDLYVTPEFRQKHIGSMLFNNVAKVISISLFFLFFLFSSSNLRSYISLQKAADNGCARLDFVVLNWNPAQDFYKRKGAIDITEQDDWHHYRLDETALKNLATAVCDN